MSSSSSSSGSSRSSSRSGSSDRSSTSSDSYDSDSDTEQRNKVAPTSSSSSLNKENESQSQPLLDSGYGGGDASVNNIEMAATTTYQSDRDLCNSVQGMIPNQVAAVVSYSVENHDGFSVEEGLDVALNENEVNELIGDVIKGSGNGTFDFEDNMDMLTSDGGVKGDEHQHTEFVNMGHEEEEGVGGEEGEGIRNFAAAGLDLLGLDELKPPPTPTPICEEEEDMDIPQEALEEDEAGDVSFSPSSPHSKMEEKEKLLPPPPVLEQQISKGNEDTLPKHGASKLKIVQKQDKGESVPDEEIVVNLDSFRGVDVDDLKQYLLPKYETKESIDSIPRVGRNLIISFSKTKPKPLPQKKRFRNMSGSESSDESFSPLVLSDSDSDSDYSEDFGFKKKLKKRKAVESGPSVGKKSKLSSGASLSSKSKTSVVLQTSSHSRSHDSKQQKSKDSQSSSSSTKSHSYSSKHGQHGHHRSSHSSSSKDKRHGSEKDPSKRDRNESTSSSSPPVYVETRSPEKKMVESMLNAVVQKLKFERGTSSQSIQKPESERDRNKESGKQSSSKDHPKDPHRHNSEKEKNGSSTSKTKQHPAPYRREGEKDKEGKPNQEKYKSLKTEDMADIPAGATVGQLGKDHKRLLELELERKRRPLITRPKKDNHEVNSGNMMDQLTLKLKKNNNSTNLARSVESAKDGVPLKFSSFKIPKKKDPEKAKLVNFISILKKEKDEFIVNEEGTDELRPESERKVRFTVPEGHREEHTKKKMREIEKDRRKKLKELAQARKEREEAKKKEGEGGEVKEKEVDEIKKENDTDGIKKEKDAIKQEESSELFFPDNVTPTMSTDCVPVPSTATILNGELPAVFTETC